jgi:DNA-binding transcriptional LysR family regulator
MEGGLRIQTTVEADARCIADALEEYGTTVETGDSDNWLVNLSDRGPDYAVLLGTLQDCLDRRGIASVQVVMGDHTYLMTP